MCIRHGARARRRVCSVSTCDKYARKAGMCVAHCSGHAPMCARLEEEGPSLLTVLGHVAERDRSEGGSSSNNSDSFSDSDSMDDYEDPADQPLDMHSAAANLLGVHGC